MDYLPDIVALGKFIDNSESRRCKTYGKHEVSESNAITYQGIMLAFVYSIYIKKLRKLAWDTVEGLNMFRHKY